MRAKQPADRGILLFDPGIAAEHSPQPSDANPAPATYQAGAVPPENDHFKEPLVKEPLAAADRAPVMGTSPDGPEARFSDSAHRASVSPIRGVNPEPLPSDMSVAKDHFITRGDKVFAGAHLIADFWGAKDLTDLGAMENAMRAAVDAAGATLLHIHLHHFGEGEGVSGVAVLAESHISVHTWPEREYAAFDVFMCGAARPDLAVEVLREALQPTRSEVTEILRGVV